MKKFILPACIIPAIVLVSFCLPAYQIAAKQLSSFTDTLQTPLVLYGRYIYQRENCSRCHILEDDSSNKQMVSLDGAGDIFSAGWHYRHMKDPGSMTSLSTMPAFPQLFTKKISRQKLLQLYQQQDSKHRSSDSLSLYKKMQQESTALFTELQMTDISNSSVKQQEIIALIAYLKQIATSPMRKYRDSVYQAPFYQRAAAWDQLQLDDSSTVMQYANSTNADTVAMGKKLFTQKICTACHNTDAQGAAGPNLTDDYWLHGSSSKQIVQVIANGVPDHGMQAFKSQISAEEIGMLAAYIRSVKGSHPANAKAPQGVKE
jgi:mono/diheme cytochrome c family protein